MLCPCFQGQGGKCFLCIRESQSTCDYSGDKTEKASSKIHFGRSEERRKRKGGNKVGKQKEVAGVGLCNAKGLNSTK